MPCAEPSKRIRPVSSAQNYHTGCADEYASVRRYRACKIDMVYVRDGCGTNFVKSDGTCTSGEPVTDIEWQLTTKHIFPDKRCAVVFLAFLP